MGVVRRRTRRRTMLVAGGAAYAMGRHRGAGAAEAADAAPDEAPPPPAPPQPAPAEVDTTSELEKLASLHASGALSDEEFAAAKQRILGT